LKRIAFPAISTGVYGYPLAEATPIAVNTVCDFAAAHNLPTLVRFVAFDAPTAQAYKRTFALLTRSDLQRR
jgi:O-acetyl-ADP-ribose deacetylase (regulator of RNase III)